MAVDPHTAAPLAYDLARAAVTTPLAASWQYVSWETGIPVGGAGTLASCTFQCNSLQVYGLTTAEKGWCRLLGTVADRS